MKKILYIILMVLCGGLGQVLVSCGNLLDQKSDRVIYSDKEHLNNTSDTLYSVIGIMNKIQALADRTVLLGELRGDLVDVRSNTAADLREISNFNVSTDNQYNSPRDYYMVINNCNYFLANADTALKNNRNEYIFRKEYAAVKAFRAWTYLQLVLNYGKVPLVTEPVLTKDDNDKQYEMKDIKGICEYFINDIAPYADVERPSYGTIRSNDSRLFFFPIYVLMGDLNLWAGNYRQAAWCYYKYISTRNGANSAYPIGGYQVSWMKGDTKWKTTLGTWRTHCFYTESIADDSEVITVIPGDSIPSEGNYSHLQNYFNARESNNYQASIVSSQALRNLSGVQKYCHVNSANEIVYAPDNLVDDKSGDLRYSDFYTERSVNVAVSGAKVDKLIECQKYSGRNVRIYRCAMVYLRLAEALNRAGFPRFAFSILKTGVNNNVIENDIIPYYPEEEAFLKQFDFPTSKYILRTKANASTENTIGIHSRGAGWTEYNDYYLYPERDTAEEEQNAVEDLIMDECALECAFEGTRFYDLMRVALRRNAPSYLADRVYARRGAEKSAEMQGIIAVDLKNPNNWYLNWDNQLGLSITK